MASWRNSMPNSATGWCPSDSRNYRRPTPWCCRTRTAITGTGSRSGASTTASRSSPPARGKAAAPPRLRPRAGLVDVTAPPDHQGRQHDSHYIIARTSRTDVESSAATPVMGAMLEFPPAAGWVVDCMSPVTRCSSRNSTKFQRVSTRSTPARCISAGPGCRPGAGFRSG